MFARTYDFTNYSLNVRNTDFISLIRRMFQLKITVSTSAKS